MISEREQAEQDFRARELRRAVEQEQNMIGDTCVVCGQRIVDRNHKCPRKSLRRFDAAHKRAVLDEEPEDDEPSEAERLAEGFRIMRQSRPDEPFDD